MLTADELGVAAAGRRSVPWVARSAARPDPCQVANAVRPTVNEGAMRSW
jgi:hypothetical protein